MKYIYLRCARSCAVDANEEKGKSTVGRRLFILFVIRREGYQFAVWRIVSTLLLLRRPSLLSSPSSSHAIGFVRFFILSNNTLNQ